MNYFLIGLGRFAYIGCFAFKLGPQRPGVYIGMPF